MENFELIDLYAKESSKTAYLSGIVHGLADEMIDIYP